MIELEQAETNGILGRRDSRSQVSKVGDHMGMGMSSTYVKYLREKRWNVRKARILTLHF